MASASKSKKPEINLLLVGCGGYAKEAHLPGIATFKKETECGVALHIADLEQADLPTGLQANFIRLIKDKPAASKAKLLSEHKKRPFDACIISTPPLHHKVYAEWALSMTIPVLVDKPLTFPLDAHVHAVPAKEIFTDFAELVGIAKRKEVLFLLGAQKRYQVVYRDLGAIIQGVYEATGCPVTNVVCCTGDGWWLLPDEYDREFHSYRTGGKFIHTGYHFLDIVPWLMRHASLDQALPIDHAWVTASALRPLDSYAAYGAEISKRIFDKNGSLRVDPKLGDINANLMLRLCDRDNRQRASVLFSLLHEGFSLRSSLARAELSRTKTDYLAVTQGPLLWAELRRIAKIEGEGDRVGGRAHQELTVLLNPRLTDLLGRTWLEDRGLRVPLTIKNEPLYAANSGAVSSCCENDEAPTIDFLKQVASPGGQESLSPATDHVIGVKLLSAAYRSAALRPLRRSAIRNDRPLPVRVRFGARDWSRPPGIASIDEIRGQPAVARATSTRS